VSSLAVLFDDAQYMIDVPTVALRKVETCGHQPVRYAASFKISQARSITICAIEEVYAAGAGVPNALYRLEVTIPR